jgi:hypothetical protein
LVACGRRSESDPFVPEPGAAAGGANEGGSGGEGGNDEPDDPGLGGPCVDDPQCDDGFDCTVDSCDLSLARCRHVAADAPCDDGVYCNGVETCSLTLGCRAGEVVTCGDRNTCTIDTCIEETQSCVHELRDADGDGDPTFDCTGTDCDDSDPYVSGEASERCGNQTDDDCDGDMDESDCVDPQYDRCGDALSIEETGSYEVSLLGAALDYPVSCEADVELEDMVFRDVVLAIEVPEGDGRDVSVVATAPEGEVVLAATDRCGSAADETACELGVPLSAGGKVARLYFHDLAPGAHAVYVAATLETMVFVRVDFREPTPAPENETCGTAAPLEPDVPVRAVLAGVGENIETACPSTTGDLVYGFELDEASDVRLSAVALDDYGEPVVSLRSLACTETDAELTCRYGSPRELFARALPAGSYRVGLFAHGPTEVELMLTLSSPTDAQPGEGCDDAPVLDFGETEQVTLSSRPDAVQIGCLVGAPDASFTLELPEVSDVLLAERGTPDEVNGLLLALDDCESPADVLACTVFEGSVRTVARGLPAGKVRAVVESLSGKPVAVTAFRRPAAESVFVPRADECEDAVLIPEEGGRFEGTTQNAYADYTASCDYGGREPPGAPDQMLKLELEKPRRMVFDMGQSSYDTLLVLRDASDCPGSEITGTCAPGYVDARSYLDVELPAGSYWVQIDGYDGDSGRWVLDVFSTELD